MVRKGLRPLATRLLATCRRPKKGSGSVSGPVGARGIERLIEEIELDKEILADESKNRRCRSVEAAGRADLIALFFRKTEKACAVYADSDHSDLCRASWVRRCRQGPSKGRHDAVGGRL